MPQKIHSDLTQFVRAGGSFSRVLARFPTDEIGAVVPGPRMRSLTRSLENAGSSASDIATITLALEERAPDRNAVPRFLLVHDGSLLIDESLPDVELQANESGYDELPDLIPLLRQRQRTVPYILVEANAEGGRIRTYLNGRLHPSDDVRMEGETEHLHKAHSGGLSHRRHAHHTEEVWKRNETELAASANDIIEHNDVPLLVVTGDPHVIDLVSNALSPRARAILVTFASDTLAAGASDDALDDLLASSTRRIVQAHQADAIGRAAAQEAADNTETDQRLQPIVHALQQASVETLLLDADALASQTLLALDREPWVAAVPTETFGAAVLHAIPAAEALARAAIATDAEIILVDHSALPGQASAAIIHR
jgi:hypothetical protein